MIPYIKEAIYVHDYVIWLHFDNGVQGEIDLASELDGEVYIPLKDVKIFKSFKVDSDMGTIVWENGADFAPEFLMKLISL